MSISADYNGIPVKPIPWWMKIVSFYVNAKGATFNGVIYLREDFFNQFTRNELDAKIKSMMAHEAAHLKRAKKDGSFRWVIKYYLSSNFRLNEELKAIKEEMCSLKANGADFDIEDRARKFSGAGYLWMTSYPEAKKLLSNLWETQ